MLLPFRGAISFCFPTFGVALGKGYSSVDAARNELMLQLAEFNAGIDRFAEKNVYIAALKGKLASSSTSSSDRLNPVAFWGYFLLKAPEFAESVIALLTCSSTEAAVERSFSAQKFVHSPLRYLNVEFCCIHMLGLTQSSFSNVLGIGYYMKMLSLK